MANARQNLFTSKIYWFKFSHLSPSINWYKYFENCGDNDEITKNRSKKYCFSVGETFSFVPANFTLPRVDNGYAAKNVYCKWKFTNINPDEYVLIEVFQIEDGFFISVDGEYLDGDTFAYQSRMSNFVFNAKNIKFFNVHFLSVNMFEYPPFLVRMSYKKLSRSFLSTFLSVGTIVLLIGLFAILAFRCYHAIKIRNRLRREGQQNVRELNYIIANNPGIVINFDQQAQAEAILKNKNKLVIDKLLETDLKPIFYKELLNEFKSSCTICMESFLEDKSEVTLLNCKHIFHHNCLKNWLFKNLTHPKCPNCNYNVVDSSSNPNSAVRTNNNPNSNNFPVNPTINIHDNTQSHLNNISSNIMIVNNESASTSRRNNDNINNNSNRYISLSNTRHNGNNMVGNNDKKGKHN